MSSTRYESNPVRIAAACEVVGNPEPPPSGESMKRPITPTCFPWRAARVTGEVALRTARNRPLRLCFLSKQFAIVFIAVASFCVLCRMIVAQETPPPSPVAREWVDICTAVAEGKDRGEILDALSGQMRAFQAGAQLPVEIATGLSAISLADKIEKKVGDDPLPRTASEEELAERLIQSKLPIDAFRGWFRAYDWQAVIDLPENEQSDPAIRLLQRGRKAVPALVKLLDDQAGTRTILPDPRQEKPPMVLTRGDVALTLIESITRTRFVDPRNVEFLQEMRQLAREETIETVRNWWNETKDLSEIESLAWWIVRAENHQRAAMIAIMPREEWDVANRCMREIFDGLPPGNGQRNQLAIDLAQRGDHYGLLGIIDQLSAHDALRQQNMRTLMQYGEVEEFKRLARMLREDIELNKDEVGSFSRLTMYAVKDTAHPLTIPLCIEALASRVDANRLNAQRNLSGDPTYLADVAAEHIQLLTGMDFGYMRSANAKDRMQVFDEIQEWWKREGESRYGFAAQEALSTPAIR